jgi:hypothetical protein
MTDNLYRKIDELLEKATKKQLVVGCFVFCLLFIAVTIALIVVSVQYDECRNKVCPEKVCPEKVCPEIMCLNPTDSRYLRYGAHTIDGNDIGDSEEEEINITSDECAKRCDNNKDCTGFVYHLNKFYNEKPFDGSAPRCQLKSIKNEDDSVFMLGRTNYYEKRDPTHYFTVIVWGETGDEQISISVNGTRYPKTFKPTIRKIGSAYYFATKKKIESVKIELLNKVPTDKKKIHILHAKINMDDITKLMVPKDNTYVYQS